MPKDTIAQNNNVWDRIEIGHFRESESYTDNWYGALDMDEQWHEYTFRVPRSMTSFSHYGGSKKEEGDLLYVTVETYYAEIIPSACTTGYDSNNYYSEHPTL